MYFLTSIAGAAGHYRGNSPSNFGGKCGRILRRCTLPLDSASASSNAHNPADLQAVRTGHHYRKVPGQSAQRAVTISVHIGTGWRQEVEVWLSYHTEQIAERRILNLQRKLRPSRRP